MRKDFVKEFDLHSARKWEITEKARKNFEGSRFALRAKRRPLKLSS
jgi:hypothetical protein